MEYYSVMRKKQSLSFGTIWVEFEGIMVTNKSYCERHIIYYFCYIWNINCWSHRNRMYFLSDCENGCLNANAIK